MKNFFKVTIILFVLISCTEKKGLEKYFNETDSKIIKLNIVKYLYINPPNLENKSKYDKEFDKFYLPVLDKFEIDQLEMSTDSVYYYSIIRPVGKTNEFKRGVIGKFKLRKKDLMPIEFVEEVNTPHLKIEDVKIRGTFLFNEYVKNNNLDKYIEMKHYVEWPDSSLVYDRKINQWIPKNRN